ncbi:MAG TPA: TonB-dependent receptor [Bryobacteraceae bacterium]|nr:TonB-dependent receptor [Bryobacteraceae bacterium]
MPVRSQTTGGLTGVVTDTSGAAMPDVKVTLLNTETGAQREGSTNNSGIYEFNALPPAVYKLTYDKTGFSQVVRDAIRLEVNQIARVDVAMTVGAVSQNVEVTGSAAPLLESSTSQVGTVIDTKSVGDLPLNGRNFAQLSILGTGVVGVGYGPSGTIGSGTRPDDPRPGAELMSNGNREMSNDFLLDGVDDNFRRNALITLRPLVEDIQEFKIQTNLFGAEQGRNSGATVDVITKSGTNAYHGSLFELLRNNYFDARNFFNDVGQPQPEYRQNQFGGSFGGPIKHNKIFFFGDYEGFRKLQGTTTDVNTVPTVAERTGDFSAIPQIVYDPASLVAAPGTASGFTRTPFAGNVIPASRFDPIDSRVIQAYPLPMTSAFTNNQDTNPVLGQNWNSGDIRVDWNLSAADTMFARFSKQDTLTNTPSTFGFRNVPGLSIPVSIGNNTNYAGRAPMSNYNNVLAWTHLFSPTFLVDARMGYSRFAMRNVDATAPTSGEGLGEMLGIPNSNQEPESLGFPIFAISGYTGIGGPAAIPTIRYENTFNPAANFTKMMGRHTIKWGVSLVRRQIVDFQDNSGNGQYSFDSTFDDNPNSPSNSGNAMADFLLGVPGGITQAFQLAWAGTRVMEMGTYVADDYKVTDRLTLNLGLRWEYLPPPVEVDNRFANFDTQTGKVLIAGYNSDRQVGVNTQYKMFAPRLGFAYQLDQKTVLRGGFGIFYNAAGNGGALYRMHRQLPFGATTTEQINELSATYLTVAQGLPTNPTLNVASIVNSPTGSWYSIPPNYRNGYAEQFNFGVERQLPFNIVLKAAYLGNLGRDLDATYNINQPIPGPGALGPRELLYNIAPGVAADDYAATDGLSAYHSLQVTVEKRYSSGLNFLSSYTYSHSIDDVPLQEGGGDDGPLPQDPRYRFLDFASSSFDIRHRYTQTVNYLLPIGTGRRFKFASSWADKAFGDWQVNVILTAQTGLPFTPVLANPTTNTGSSSRPNIISGVSPTVPNPTINDWFNTSFNTAGAVWATPALYTFGNAGRNILRGPGRTNLDFSLFKDFSITERIHLQLRGELFNIFNHPQFDLPAATIGQPGVGAITDTIGTPRDIQVGLRLVF